MKVVYFGSSRFSIPPLQAISKHISCVVTRRAKPKGRGQSLEDTEVKREATNLQLPVLEIDSFKDESINDLVALKPDLFVVASFGLMVPRWVLDIPSVGPVNIHPSLLPKYRGPSPIQWALLNGDVQTGITFMRMNEKMDAGNILYQEPMVIDPADNAITLSDRLARRSAEILIDFLHEIETNGLQDGILQNNALATFTPILTKEMGKIDWRQKGEQIVRQVKAFIAWPTAYTFLDSLFLKIFDGTALGDDTKDGTSTFPGTILEIMKQGIHVRAGSGVFIIKELQLQNKKRMSAYYFSQGYRGLAGKVLKDD